jgi:Family of unknown function (DUF6077)
VPVSQSPVASTRSTGGRRSYPCRAHRASRAAVRIGILDRIGHPNSAARPLSTSTPAAPASDRLCDTVLVAFALWTVSSHAIVAAGRALLALLALYAVVLAAALLLKLRLGAVAAPSDATGPAALPDSPGPTLPTLRVAALVAGTATALSFAAWADVLLLWWSLVILLGVAAVAVCFKDTARISPPEGGHSSELLLWLLAAAGVVLTLISHRPDADDAFYVNVAVTAVDAPGRALLSGDTMHGIPGLPLNFPIYRVHSYELLNGALAYLTGIPAIYSFHWLSAAFAALLVPLAHARLFRILTPRQWLATVATLMFVLVAAGETHRWYGNFSFVRMWQGKSIALFVFMPLVYAYALRFAVRPNLRHWAMLALAQIAAVGSSSSALWVAPVGAGMALCSAVRPSGRGLKTVVLGTLASGYVLGAAWLVRGSLEASMGGWMSRGGQAGPAVPLLQNALVTVLGDSRLLIFAIVSLPIAWVFLPPGLGRRFAVVAPLAALLGLLNPYTAAWVSRNLTGPSYWRSMWALPVPILMALMLTSPLRLGDGSSRPGARRAAWLVLLAAFALLIPRYTGLSPENGVQLSWPKLKVPDAAYRWAVAVNESVPEGSHVAVPSDIDPWIVTLHHHVFPLLVRRYVRTWGKALTREDLGERDAMRRFLDNPELVEATPELFRDGLDRFEVRAVCLVSSPKSGAARTVLQQAGFRPTLRRDDYELWVRRGRGSNLRRWVRPGRARNVGPDGEAR